MADTAPESDEVPDLTAAEAKALAEAALRETAEQWDEVHAVAGPLRMRLERNHFAEMFQKALAPKETTE